MPPPSTHQHSKEAHVLWHLPKALGSQVSMEQLVSGITCKRHLTLTYMAVEMNHTYCTPVVICRAQCRQGRCMITSQRNDPWRCVVARSGPLGRHDLPNQPSGNVYLEMGQRYHADRHLPYEPCRAASAQRCCPFKLSVPHVRR
jgi:hypothetical protein